MNKLAIALLVLLTSTIVSCKKDSETPKETDENTDGLSAENPIIIPNSYIVLFEQQVLENFETYVAAKGGTEDHDELAQWELLYQRENKNKIEDIIEKLAIDKSHIEETFSGEISGCSGNFTDSEIQALKADKAVVLVAENIQVELFSSCDPLPVENLSSKQSKDWWLGSSGIGTGTLGTNYANNSKWVWIVDSGIDQNHPDLNVVHSVNFIRTGAKDNVDYVGHGTFMAGLIGAKDNNFGVSGLAPNCRLASVKITNNSSFDMVNVLLGLNHVINNSLKGDVAVFSFGYNNSGLTGDLKKLSDTIESRVISLGKKGVKIAIAAGNNYKNTANIVPAKVNGTNIFTIGGYTCTKSFWKESSSKGSNYGTAVDYVLPAVNLTSCLPTNFSVSNPYAKSDGTSFAAPIAAGILYLKGSIANGGTIKRPGSNHNYYLGAY